MDPGSPGLGVGPWGVGTGTGTITTGTVVGGPASGPVGLGRSSRIVVHATSIAAASEARAAGDLRTMRACTSIDTNRTGGGCSRRR